MQGMWTSTIGCRTMMGPWHAHMPSTGGKLGRWWLLAFQARHLPLFLTLSGCLKAKTLFRAAGSHRASRPRQHREEKLGGCWGPVEANPWPRFSKRWRRDSWHAFVGRMPALDLQCVAVLCPLFYFFILSSPGIVPGRVRTHPDAGCPVLVPPVFFNFFATPFLYLFVRALISGTFFFLSDEPFREWRPFRA